jgi:hypothetical protein
MAVDLPAEVDTLIVGMFPSIPRPAANRSIGNGPSALILSYILHGHIPVYDPDSPHPDALLHEKLKQNQLLTDLDVDYLTEHFLASRYSYSTQALPVNVLLDALIRPYGETEGTTTCVKWKYDPSKAVSHLVVGNTKAAGGQWVDNPVQASWDIGTLSYAGMLSLPGYSFAAHYERTHGRPLPFYLRPTRKDVAAYFAAYPAQVGISGAIHNAIEVSGIERVANGFYVASHGIRCQRVVLASGIFSQLIPPRSLLQPLTMLPSMLPTPTDLPLLVIGSGFSAADVIISANPGQKLIHIFKWDPSKHPSPLRACHSDSYPEYAGVYKRMKLCAVSTIACRQKRPRPSRTKSATFDLNRNWDMTYEGLPNTMVTAVKMAEDDKSAIITLQAHDGQILERQICAMTYVVGRRGAMGYLSPAIQQELLPDSSPDLISGSTFREKAHQDMEMAKDIFIIGSLTGDSLIRFSYGSCAYTAGKILKRCRDSDDDVDSCGSDDFMSKRSSRGSPLVPAMNGLDGHNSPTTETAVDQLERIRTA